MKQTLSVADTVMSLSHPLNRAWRSVERLFRRPARLQIAALCYRFRNGVLEVLLVSSKSSGRWILPKGWPILHRKAHRTAGIEAFEEAGVVGKVSKKPYARFRSTKGFNHDFRVRTDVLVFLLRAEAQKDDFPEAGQRTALWLPIDEAIGRCSEEGLAAVLRLLKHDMAARQTA
ncbi:NUDIX hydrolase [Polymorphum gilvum]|uniref:NTP pyrophosphohydrolase, MutT family protein n=1 Tax=Polymorphum gilvum (strain LMG 25793 / CGMCC 1.9160 / SL003B-26A1) TaxID=991905 RepID=F2IWP5_POLGS|nr:NUDIX hydrolase [Polymorphum gilvum]ADZ70369.1 NTP pyrophosphohydrolase, MutT family protein [Polymorphum gilvum SL003B-26A1]